MADKVLKLNIMTPDRTFYDGEASMVEFTSTEGELGIYPGHIPLASIVAPGVLTIHEAGGEVKKAALHSGFAKISTDEIMILAEVIEWPDEIDINRANEAKERAQRRLSGKDSGLDIQRAELALKRSLTRISLKG